MIRQPIKDMYDHLRLVCCYGRLGAKKGTMPSGKGKALGVNHLGQEDGDKSAVESAGDKTNDNEPLSTDQIIEKTIAAFMKAHIDTNKPPSKNVGDTGSRSRSDIICHHCKVAGHIKRNCNEWKELLATQGVPNPKGVPNNLQPSTTSFTPPPAPSTPPINPYYYPTAPYPWRPTR